MRPWRPGQWSVSTSSSPGRRPTQGSLVLKERGPCLLPPALQPEVGSQAGRSPQAVAEVLGHLEPLWAAMGVPS